MVHRKSASDADRRVALISSSFFPYTGGVEEHTRQVASALQEIGVPVVIWTVDRGEGLGVQSVDGIRVRYLPTPLPSRTGSAIAGFALKSPKAAASWMSAFRADRPDILHVQCFGPNGVYALGLHRATGTTLIVSSHGETFADDHDVFGESHLLRSTLRTALKCAAAATGCSSLVVDDLRRRFGSLDASVVPNGVRVSGVAEAVAGAGPDLVAVGRLERIKGFDLLLRAVASHQRLRNRKVTIAGDGSQMVALKALTAELGLAQSVEFPGQLDRHAVDRLLRASTVAVVPSRQEAFGMVILEAWKAATPVVATTRGGPALLIEPGVDGVLQDPEDIEGLAVVLDGLLSDPVRRELLARKGSQRVFDFTWDAVAAQYEALYRQVVP